MKRTLFFLIGAITGFTVMAQTDTTRSSEITPDTIKVGGLIIIKKKGSHNDDRDNTGVNIDIGGTHRNKRGNIETNWGIVDIGFAGFNDKTNYSGSPAQTFAPGSNADWFDTRTGKTTNVNVWFFMQKLAVDKKHYFSLKYGLGLEMNNYRFTENIKFEKNPTKVIKDNISYSKNKLATDYITVPMMVNFNFTPERRRGFGFSAGVSAGYLYSSRQKLKSSENGKQKIRDDFDLEPFKISYIGELNLGEVRLYGSYAAKNIWKKGLDWAPYSVGIRFSNW
ncbi:MAG: outer membrane beta-barrel protein [Sphingobacteriales bacterium]|nr:outer membrane beta-barrel protein [Sphingobacteriales bacterium]